MVNIEKNQAFIWFGIDNFQKYQLSLMRRRVVGHKFPKSDV